MFDKKTVFQITHLCGKDNKMLLINGRYYCHFTGSDLEMDPDPNYWFFSGYWKETCCPTYAQYANVYINDVVYEKGHHEAGFGKLYHNVHKDLAEDGYDDFFLHFPDNSSVNATSIEVIDMPFKLKNLIDLLIVTPKIKEPIMSIDGVSFVDFGEYDKKSISLEYYINGKLYFEVVDFNDVPDMGIVNIDSPRRNIVIAMQKLTADNVVNFAKIINDTLTKYTKAK